ncbi:MAG: chitobiase/beta-hexosaminidase C-terminal domain-containing protein [Candidatus ainarchaeum sp.]|nr:chitobiase/beta-hexosaminidase C-terminal domain-containing protein [Candidatus ainarchaeum sp.]
MTKIKKGQVSLEAIIIIGVIVLASIIFATFYISNVNKKIDTASNLDPNFSGMIGSDEMGSIDPIDIGEDPGPGPGGSTCGNDIVEGTEDCDGTDLNGATCETEGQGSGDLSCNSNCTFNNSGCSSPTTSYTITSSHGSNGSINPLGAVTVLEGASKKFSFFPNAGYDVDTVSIDGAEVSLSERRSYTFNNVTSDHTIHVTFKPQSSNEHIIFASNGSHGTIDPAGNNTVTEGDDITFTFNPDTGYRVGNVYIDSLTVGAEQIEIINDFSSKDSENNNLYFSEEDTLYFAANTGPGTSSNLVYTFEDVDDSHTIHVTFISNTTPTYTLDYIAGANGSIDGFASQTINQGEDGDEVCAVADAGYVFENWDDNLQTECRTETNVTSNQTYTVSFTEAAGQTMAMDLEGVESTPISQNFDVVVNTSETPGTVSYGLVADLLIYNDVAGDYLPTNNCSYNGTFASTHTLETNQSPGIENYTFSCNTSGNYKFTFTATDTTNPTNDVSRDKLITVVNNQTAAAPTFSIDGDTYYNDQTLILSSTTPGATIKYTINGANPTCTTGTTYSSPIQINQVSTVKAIACKSGYIESPIVTEIYNLKVGTPTPSVNPGVYSQAQTITLSTETIGATLYYSTDGSGAFDGSVYVPGEEIIISSPFTELRIAGIKSNYNDSEEYDEIYYINGYESPTPSMVFTNDYGGAFDLVGAANLTHGNVFIEDEVNNLVRFIDPKLDGNYFNGSNASGDTLIDCEAFCSEKYLGGTCYSYDTINYSGNGNDLIYYRYMIPGAGGTNDVFPYTIGGMLSNSSQWAYGSGVTGGPDRVEYFTCDFSHTPSPEDTDFGFIDLYTVDLLQCDGTFDCTGYYYDSARVTFENVTKVGSEYTYSGLNVVGNFVTQGATAPTGTVYILSDDFSQACDAVCDALYQGSSCENYDDSQISSQGKAVSYKYFSLFLNPNLSTGYYWTSGSPLFYDVYAGDYVLSEVTCSK